MCRGVCAEGMCLRRVWPMCNRDMCEKACAGGMCGKCLQVCVGGCVWWVRMEDACGQGVHDNQFFHSLLIKLLGYPVLS